MTKILGLHVENIKRIKTVSIIPDGDVIVLGGQNGEGKSSTLDSICMGIGGKDLIPTKPVREGEQQAKIVVDLGEYVATRHWTSPDKSYLKLENKLGAKMESPQKILDQLIGNLSFDPLAFATLKSAERVKILKELTGLDFGDLDKEYTLKYTERTLVKKEGEQLKTLLEGFADLENVPNEPIDIPALNKEIEDIREYNAKLDGMGERKKVREVDIARTKNDINNLEIELGNLKDKIEATRKRLTDQEATLAEDDKNCANLVKKDPAPVQAKIQEAMTQEANRKRLSQKEEFEAKIKVVRTNYAALDSRLKVIEETKIKLVTEAKMPIDGLSLGDGEILFNSIPFTQLCSSEQIRVSMSIAMALNPKLRVIIIKNGSLLDKKAMAELAGLAKKNDFQVWVESVMNTPDGNCIYIEDGGVLGAEPVVQKDIEL